MDLLSPKLKQLVLDIKQSKEEAINRFFDEIEVKGTPLFEIVNGKQLVTFIIKKKNDVDQYIIISSVSGYELENNIFELLEGTDIYFKSYYIEKASRTTYYFGVNLPLDFNEFWKNREQYKNQCFYDSLNPKKFIWPKNEEYGEDEFTTSIIECPDCEKQYGLLKNETIPNGNLIKMKVTSKILNNTRSVWVYTPPYYDDSKTYPLMVTVDGFEYTTVTPTPTILDNLIVEKKIPPIVSVFIGNVDKDSRDIELTCNEGFMNFVVMELIPFIRNNYNITSNPKETIIAGASFGGLCASFLALNNPHIFGKVLSQSGSYWWDKYNLISQYQNREKLPIEFYLDVGVLENKERMVMKNQQFRDILRDKGYVVHYKEFVGGHDHICWRGTLSIGLVSLIGN